MALEIIERVKQALNGNGPSLRQSELAALVSVTEHLWASQLAKTPSRDDEHRRLYMREYMRRYRSEKRARALQASSAT